MSNVFIHHAGQWLPVIGGRFVLIGEEQIDVSSQLSNLSDDWENMMEDAYDYGEYENIYLVRASEFSAGIVDSILSLPNNDSSDIRVIGKERITVGISQSITIAKDGTRLSLNPDVLTLVKAGDTQDSFRGIIEIGDGIETYRDIVVSGFWISGVYPEESYAGAGINARRVEGLEISNCKVEKFKDFGIVASNCSNVTIKGNTVSNNGGMGILVHGSERVIVENNTAVNNDIGMVVYVQGGSHPDSRVRNNSVKALTGVAMSLVGFDDSVVENNTISSNGLVTSNINLVNCNRTLIKNNQTIGAKSIGIALTNSSNNHIITNAINSSLFDISLSYKSLDNTIENELNNPVYDYYKTINMTKYND